MRTADTVFSIIRERGKRGLPLERVQHLLYNEELSLRAYAKLYPNDPDYRRLRFVRYADDWALGFSGPKAEAEQIKQELRDFLREVLKLELSEEKTLITHARTHAAKFLGYHIGSQHADDKLDRRGERASQRDGQPPRSNGGH